MSIEAQVRQLLEAYRETGRESFLNRANALRRKFYGR